MGLALTSALPGCVAHARGELVADYPAEYVESVPVRIEYYRHTYYRGSPAYLVEGRWYYRSRDRWAVFREEPVELRDYRVRYAPRYAAPPTRSHGRAREYQVAERREREREQARRFEARREAEHRADRLREERRQEAERRAQEQRRDHERRDRERADQQRRFEQQREAERRAEQERRIAERRGRAQRKRDRAHGDRDDRDDRDDRTDRTD